MQVRERAYWVLRQLSELKSSFSGGINSRVLIYHDLQSHHLEIFAKHLEVLVALFDEMVTASEFIQLYQSGQLQDKKYCCITFDDGFESLYTRAKPILDKYNIKATLFLSQSFYDLKNSQNPEALKRFVESKFPRHAKSNPALRSVSRDHVLSLINSGHEIGGHTYTHTSVSEMNQADFERELIKQRQFFKKEFNYHIRSFAYPYGRSENIPLWGAETLKNAGYDSGFTGISRNTTSKALSRYAFPRTSVSLDLSGKYFLHLLRGSHDFLDKLTFQY